MSERPGRYERSTSGMVGAMIVTLLVILAFVVFRACNRTDLRSSPSTSTTSPRWASPSAPAPTWSTPRALPTRLVRHATSTSPGARSPSSACRCSPTGANEYAGFLPVAAPGARAPHDVRRRAPDLRPAGHPRQRDRDAAGRPGPTAAATPPSSRSWHGELADGLRWASQADLEQLAGSLTTRSLASTPSGQPWSAPSPSIAASSRARAPSSHSWQRVASFSPRSQSARLSSSVVPPASSARTTSTSSARASS